MTSAHCTHPAAAWAAVGGIHSCTACGTQRFADYRALALALPLPERPSPGPTRQGHSRAALLAKVREANLRSTKFRP
ncbi:hypothetical protein VR41_05200 [Streptomyces sp. NRRL B-1568]|nr:hypothetical protein VR41_05200 [Streptomyces sp. NRRL B-1568]